MTGAGAGRAAACGRAAVRRTAATLVLDLRRQAAEGYWFVALLAGLMVGGGLLALAGDPRRWWPVVVLAELSITSFYFAAVQVLRERGEGTLAARALTPLGPGEYLAALAASLCPLALAEVGALVLAALGAVDDRPGRPHPAPPRGPGRVVAVVPPAPTRRRPHRGRVRGPSGRGRRALRAARGRLVRAPGPRRPGEAGARRHCEGGDELQHYLERTGKCAPSPRGGGLMRPRAMLGLLPADLRRLARDELLVWMPAVPLAMALAARLGVPALLRAVGPGGAGAREWAARIDVAAFAIVVPVLVGTVVGFMLLGEKEDGVWSVLAVTPTSLRGYLIWRAAGAVIVAAAAGGVCTRLAGLDDLGAARTAVLAAAGAPLAGAAALSLAAWAANTVQGFAAVKLSLIVLVLPAVVPRDAGAWRWPLAAIPSWWPVRAYWDLTGPGSWWPAWLLGSVAVGLAIMAAGLRRAAP